MKSLKNVKLIILDFLKALKTNKYKLLRVINTLKNFSLEKDFDY